MRRRNQILIGVLVLQLVLVAIVFWPRQATMAAVGQALFPGLTADQISSVSLTDDDGDDIHLVKSDSGWVLPEADDYPAVSENVTALLDKIVDLTAKQLITQTSASHKRLEVAESDFNVRIEFELSDGSQHSMYVGSSPSYGSTHVRVDDQDQVYLVSDFSSSDASSRVSAWVESTYFSVTQDEVVELTLENANGSLEFLKDQDGAWTMTGLDADETLDQDAVTSLVSSASSVTMQKPLGKEEQEDYGLQDPIVVLSLKTQSEAGGEMSYILLLGAQDAADEGYILISSTSPYYVQVSSSTANNWIEKGRDDFLEVSPTATP